MANSITLVKQFVKMLDEAYKLASLTSDLDGASELVRQGANANELIIPKLSMSGLGDYSRNGGYVAGDVTLTNETVKCNFDRGRLFTVDALDNQESAYIAFGRLAGEFIRTKVVPELDAFRFATYSGITGISKVSAGASLSDGAAVIAALRAAITKMDEDEVPPVIGPVEGFEFEKGIDPEGEIGEGRGRGRLRVVRKHQPLGKRRAAGKQRKACKYGIARGSIRRGVPAGYENLCGGALRRGRFGWFEHFTEIF